MSNTLPLSHCTPRCLRNKSHSNTLNLSIICSHLSTYGCVQTSRQTNWRLNATPSGNIKKRSNTKQNCSQQNLGKYAVQSYSRFMKISDLVLMLHSRHNHITTSAVVPIQKTITKIYVIQRMFFALCMSSHAT